MRTLPNMAVVAPVDANEMRRFMPQTLDWSGPIYIRLGKGGDPVVSRDENGFSIGQAIVMHPAGDILFVSTGVMTERCLRAARILATHGITAGVLHAHTVKPLDHDVILQETTKTRLVVTVEEHFLAGGLGSAVAELFADTGMTTPLRRLGIPDGFTKKYGSQDDLLASFGLSPEGLANTAICALKIESP
jgi:transketolase